MLWTLHHRHCERTVEGCESAEALNARPGDRLNACAVDAYAAVCIIHQVFTGMHLNGRYQRPAHMFKPPHPTDEGRYLDSPIILPTLPAKTACAIVATAAAYKSRRLICKRAPACHPRWLKFEKLISLVCAFGVHDQRALRASRMENGELAWDYHKVNVAIANCGNAQLIGFLRILDALSRPEVSLCLVLVAQFDRLGAH